MPEQWEQIRDFEDYSVSDYGRVRNDHTDRIMHLSVNQNGIVHVGLMRDGEQYKRAVSRMVAIAFIPRTPGSPFDTPINLDGDRTNNHVDNLMWRPRWFAAKYHAQFHNPNAFTGTGRIRDRRTGKKYPSSYAVCVKFGLLERDLIVSMMNSTYVFPTFQFFEVIE